jgi:hypothetical protein
VGRAPFPELPLSHPSRRDLIKFFFLLPQLQVYDVHLKGEEGKRRAVLYKVKLQ